MDCNIKFGDDEMKYASGVGLREPVVAANRCPSEGGIGARSRERNGAPAGP